MAMLDLEAKGGGETVSTLGDNAALFSAKPHPAMRFPHNQQKEEAQALHVILLQPPLFWIIL